MHHDNLPDNNEKHFSRKKVIILIVLVATLFLLYTLSKAEEIKTYSKTDIFDIPQIDQEIKIDGIMDEPAWQNALKISFNNEISPGDNTPASIETIFYIMYDNHNIYAGFIAQDPEPAKIRAHISDRDKAWLDDIVGIFFDTFNDENRAFGFFVNPLGIQNDEIQSDGGRVEDLSWDGIWDSAGKITDDGYVVEIMIPFRTIQFQRSASKQIWGFAPVRIYPRNQRYQMSCFKLDRNNDCLQCQFPKISGFEGISPGKNIELNPTITGIRTRTSNAYEDEPIPETNGKADIGLTGYYGLTTNLRLSGTINPDFSQVEADAAQLDVNKQFALFYPEKRPFFLEGMDFFSTPQNIAYTRTMADPDWGIKLSGKEGKNSVGLFFVSDNITNLLFPGSQSSDSETLEQHNTAAVLRFRRDFANSSNIGIIVTDRESANYHNRVAGIDGLLRITKSDSITFQFLGSNTAYPLNIITDYNQKTGSLTGTSSRISYAREQRTYYLNAYYENFSPDFRADLGFIPQVDYHKWTLMGRYFIRGEKDDFFALIVFGPDYHEIRDYSSNLLDRIAEIEFEAQAPLQSYFYWNTTYREKVYDNVSFKNQFSHFLYFQIKPSGIIYFEFETNFGDDIDYDNTRPAKLFYVEPEAIINLGKNISASISYEYHHLKVEEGELFRAHLAQLNLTYHFNSRAFFRGIIQYADINRNAALYFDEVDPEEQTLFAQLLFSYKLNPRTVLFLGYTDNRLGYLNTNLAQTDRTLFIKIGYAWNL
ncbi:MAG: hypothetical protein A2Y62_13265 [Candidatus Fischerbacteria bacterium RBG_13_37_8]|uniref:Uncharacterized protein n=1 Tax=Candidatus Fischerbacteria bacterium RBG_13_37_8 TaxID=1817863 RepID=A0A1F5VNA5_9BACT|nr:MAG: hypothetical protein A2Y62_13265 [Candidatus Fischerbacteria bacterium RBG_13_37_8]